MNYLLNLYLLINIALLIVAILIYFQQSRFFSDQFSQTNKLRNIKHLIIAAIVLPILLLTLPLNDWLARLMSSQTILASIALVPSLQSIMASKTNSAFLYWQYYLIVGAFSLCFLYHGIQIIREGLSLYRIKQRAILLRQFSAVEIWITTETSVPFTTNLFFRNQIFIPERYLTQPNQLKSIIAHECQHFRQNDPIWAILMQILKLLFCINPFVYRLITDLVNAQELACDEKIVLQNRISKLTYGNCLIECARNNLIRSENMLTTTIISQSKNHNSLLQKRLAILTTDKTTVIQGNRTLQNGFMFFSILSLLCILNACQLPNHGIVGASTDERTNTSSVQSKLLVKLKDENSQMVIRSDKAYISNDRSEYIGNVKIRIGDHTMFTNHLILEKRGNKEYTFYFIDTI